MMAMIDRYQAYAEEIAILGGLKSPALRAALAKVRRDCFLPPGPWLIESLEGTYFASDSAEISQILHGVGVALDPVRRLNNANPVKVCVHLQIAEIMPGQRIFHVGAGLGYFSALMAELVGPQGQVIAAEIDPELRRRAADTLSPWPQVQVIGDALTAELPMLDLIYASAGLADMPASWPERLKQGGRMILPLTGHHDHGAVILLQRLSANGPLAARSLSFTRYFPCLGARDPTAVAAVSAAFTRPISELQSLRLDRHDPDQDCWLHRHTWCLSSRSP